MADVDFSTLPDKKIDFSSLPDKSIDFSTLPDKRKVTTGLFGTSIGEESDLLRKARIPAEMARSGLNQMIDVIPEPQTPSVAKNVLYNIPKTALQIGAEFSSSMLDPETAMVAGAGKVISPIVKSPLVKEIGGVIGKRIPDPVKRLFTYRFGQPEAYKELAEQRLLKIGAGGEKAKEVGTTLSEGLSKAEQLRLGQIVKGGISTGESELGLRTLAETARKKLTDLGEEAVEQGLLDEQTYLNNLKTYMPRLYRKYELAIKEGKGVSTPELFGAKPQRIIGKRFMQRKDIPEEVRTSMGEIKEPAYPVAKGIAQLTHDIETAKMFKAVAENPEWASIAPKAGFIQLTGTKRKLGALADKYVHPEIARDLNEVVRTPEIAEKFYKDLLSKWKFGKVVLNPSTHARNMMSNSILLDLSGVDLAQQPRLLSQSLMQLRRGGNYFNEAKQAGLLGNEFYGAEIKNLINGFSEPAETILGKGINIAKKFGDKLGQAYQAEEQWFKLAKFISEREKGIPVKQAVQEAEKWLFNYNKISPAVKALRSSPVGAPFITFTSKALPRVAEVALTNPIRLYKYKMLFDSIENIAREKLDIKDEDYNLVKRSDRGQTVIMPFKDKNGELQTLDLSYILPWGDIGEQGGLFGTPPSLSPGGLVKPLAEVGLNKSQFTQKKIYDNTDLLNQKLQKSADFLYKSYMPSFAPKIPFITKGGYSFQKVVNAIEEKPDYFGRIRSIPTVLVDVIAGLKLSPQTPKLLDYFEKKGFMNEAKEIKILKFKLANKGLTEEEKLNIKQDMQDKVNRLKAKILETRGTQ